MSDARASLPPISLPPSSLQIAASPHYAFLDGMRGFAALYVVLHHIAIHVPAAPNATTAEQALRHIFDFGHSAVDVFIVLSGYCLMLPVLRRGLNTPEFLLRRAVRILPPYYAAMLGSWLLIATLVGVPTGTHWDLSIPVHGFDIWTHLALLQDWVSSTESKINHAHWSVAVEWKIYFLFPTLLWAFHRWGGLRTVFGVTFASYGLWLVLRHFGWLNPSPWGSSVYYVGLFSFGMLAAELGEAQQVRERGFVRQATLVLVATTAMLTWVTLFGVEHRPLPLQLRSGLVGAWGAALMLLLRSSALPAVVSRPFSAALPRWIGRIAFSLYLTHAPLIQLVYWWIVRPLNLGGLAQVIVLLVAATPICLAVAALFYRLIEVPFHEWSRRLRLRRAPRQVQLELGHSGMSSR
jgi:peptidoglycan/LPS O-acetylase OafA/YrhL